MSRFLPRLVETSGGEVEPEACSPGASLAEALTVLLALQGALWLGAGRPPAPGDAAWPSAVGVALAALGVAYAILVAPWIHGDGWHGVGISRPFEIRTAWREWGLVSRAIATAVVVVIPLLLAWAGWDLLLVRLGIRRTWPDLHRQLLAAPWRQIGASGAAAVLAVALAAVLVRWTNLGTAARRLAWPTAAMLAAIAGATAVAASGGGNLAGAGPFSRAGRGDGMFLAHLAVYVPWALLQQWVLLGYFNTRLRKLVPRAGRGRLPGRAIVATLTGAAFAIMHAPHPALMILTLASGAVWGWLFQRDLNRNLFLVALAHALLGTLAGLSVGGGQ